MIKRKKKAPSKSRSSRDRVRAYRAKLRKQGMKPIQIWVPDVNSPEFARAAHEQSLAAARSRYEKEDQAWVDAISIGWDEE
jgi:DNA-binding LacI/PurR family transcriptional regulator